MLLFVLWLSIKIYFFFMKGLFGNFDGNLINDFKVLNGDIILLNFVESVIYIFGKLCKFVFIVVSVFIW